MTFRFKEFEIQHGNSLLKVNTDAVLLGALMHSKSPISLALDIGTGCGIIAMMVAQKFPSTLVEAIEIDIPSGEEATLNFAESKFSNRLKFHLISFQQFETSKQYELIFSNPPYFETPDFSKGKNKQDISPERKKYATQFTLNFEELIYFSVPLLKPTGKFWVILPSSSRNKFITLALKNNLHLDEEIAIRSKVETPLIRSVLCFGFVENKTPTTKVITLYNADGTRHSEYASITDEFYL